MPVTVVVGGQHGSEGKGKVAESITRKTGASAVVRVGGTNSGHTSIDPDGRAWSLRQLPASAIVPGVMVYLPAGSLIDPDILLAEVSSLGLGPDTVRISANASVILEDDKAAEAGLVKSIGSTASGTGAALVRRIARGGDALLAGKHSALMPFVRDVDAEMDALLRGGKRIVVEGTQGFGLSIFHGGAYPHATSRDTTAAAFLSEAGLSPRDVDDVTMVIRAFPIRVGGNSGPLVHETTWTRIAERSGRDAGYTELTTATRRTRRIADFDPDVVVRAIRANKPDYVVLNHMDYFDRDVADGRFSDQAINFLENSIEKRIGRHVDQVGTGPSTLIERMALRIIGMPARQREDAELT